MATCRKCLRFDQCVDERGDTPFYSSNHSAANNVEDLCFAYKGEYLPNKERKTWKKKLTIKESIQTVILITAMQFGFSAMYRYIWLMICYFFGFGYPAWMSYISILLGGVTNYIFIRWCGGMNNEK